MILRGFWTVSMLTLGLASSGCEGPCDKFATRMCAQNPNDSDQCAKWQERAKLVPTETCEAGLRVLDRDRVR